MLHYVLGTFWAPKKRKHRQCKGDVPGHTAGALGQLPQETLRWRLEMEMDEP